MRLVKCEVWEKDAFFGVQVVFLFRGWRLEWGRKKKGVPRPQRAVNPNVLSRSENQMTFNTIVIDDSGPSKSSGAET